MARASAGPRFNDGDTRMSFRLLPPERRPTIAKDPSASLRYGIDVAGLLQEGDAVADASVSASSGGLTVGAPTVADTMISVRVSAGTAGEMASVTLRWNTVQGDTDERTLWFDVADR